MALRDVDTLLENYLNSDVREDEINQKEWENLLAAFQPSECYVRVRRVTTNQGCTAMHKAMYHNHTSVARLLLSSVTTNKQRLLLLKNRTSLTPVHVGAYYGHTKLLQKLLDDFTPNTCFEIFKTKNDCGETVIHRAVLGDHIDTVECLLSLVNPDQRLLLLNMENDKRETPLKLIERRLAGMRQRHQKMLCQERTLNQKEHNTWKEILQSAEDTVNFLSKRQKRAMQDVRGTELPQQETTTQAVEETGDNIGGDNNVPIQAL